MRRPDQRRGVPRALGGVCAALMLVLSSGLPAAAHSSGPPSQPPEEPADLSADSWSHAVVPYDADAAIVRYDLDRFIERLGERESEDEDVIVLSTDILFTPNSWELPETAGETIGDLVADVPEDAAVEVSGHTDSRPVGEGHDFDNQTLSENRAEAVAEALAEQRDDLELTVEGRGDTDPAVAEDSEDPSTYAANRRVEIRYDG